MSGRREILSPEGLRLDGRRPGELRTLNSKLGCIPQADGSASLSMGNTRVIVTINGPREVCFPSFSGFLRLFLNVLFHIYLSYMNQITKKNMYISI